MFCFFVLYLDSEEWTGWSTVNYTLYLQASAPRHSKSLKSAISGIILYILIFTDKSFIFGVLDKLFIKRNLKPFKIWDCPLNHLTPRLWQREWSCLIPTDLEVLTSKSHTKTQFTRISTPTIIPSSKVTYQVIEYVMIVIRLNPTFKFSAIPH